jgi:pyruvate dehydrogenase E1 component beta subunit
MVPRVLKAAEILSGDGIDAEVIDLRTLSPIDEETVLESLSRTHRIAVVHEAVKHYGFGAEIAAIVAEKGIYDLETPIKRIAAPWAPLASASSLAREYLPSVDKIVQGVKSIF